MAQSDMAAVNTIIQKATIETVAQEVDKFNAASNGAIVLSVDGFAGDFYKQNSFASLAAAQRRVDRYAANGTVTPTALAQITETSVKIAGGFGPVILEPSQMTYIMEDPVAAIEEISKQASTLIIQDQLNSAIAGAVAAIGNNGVTVTNTIATNITQVGLNGAHALFGDRSQALIAQVMSGAAYHSLIGEALTNTAYLFSAGDVRVIDILGKPVIVTDAPALTESANIGFVLSLVASGLVVNNTADFISNISTTNGNERIESTFQADYTFGLGVKGYTWDEVNGGKSPTDAEIATGTNWDQVATSDKDTAGVLVKFDPAA